MRGANIDRRARNRAHWDGSLDPANLGSRKADPGEFARQVALFNGADVRLALKHLEPLDGRVTLDLGGGLGLAAVLLARRGARVILCDLSRTRLVEARRQLSGLGLAERVEFLQAEAEHLPFSDGALERAFTKSVLIHTNQSSTAPELGRVLAACGRAAFIEPLDANPLVNAYRAVLAPGEWRSITRYFTAASLDQWGASMARPAGRAHRLRPIFLVSFLASVFQFAVPNPAAFRAVEAVLLAIDRLFLGLFPRLAARSWMGVLLIGPRRDRKPSLAGPPVSARSVPREERYSQS